jgi:hypothetical protein
VFIQKIQKEEDNLRKYLNVQHDGIYPNRDRSRIPNSAINKKVIIQLKLLDSFQFTFSFKGYRASSTTFTQTLFGKIL